MKPYFDRYPGNENISWSLVKLEELYSLLIQVIDWMNPKVKNLDEMRNRVLVSVHKETKKRE